MNGEDTSIDTWPDYPFAPHWLEIGTERMHYVDEGHGDPVLLLHGEPTSSFLWRKIIPQLPGRVVAPDLIGFGRSDKPEDIGWYSYDRHVDSIARLVEELDLTGLTLVVHDWGGPSGSGSRSSMPSESPGSSSSTPASAAARRRASGGSASARSCASSAARCDIGRLVEAGTAQGLGDDVRAAYDAAFPTPESKAGALAFPEMVPTEPEHPNTAPMNRVRDALREWRKPALVVWGAEDTILPDGIARAMVEMIPGCPRAGAARRRLALPAGRPPRRGRGRDPRVPAIVGQHSS